MTLQEVIFEALDNAEEGGYFDPSMARGDGGLAGLTAAEIALDLLDYDALTFELAPPDEASVPAIMPLVEAWRAAKGLIEDE